MPKVDKQEMLRVVSPTDGCIILIGKDREFQAFAPSGTDLGGGVVETVPAPGAEEGAADLTPTDPQPDDISDFFIDIE